MKSNIAVIGFMGTGKSAVGKALAQRLNKEFIEMDSGVEKLAGKSIPEIFRDDGEIAFRELEIQFIKQIAGKKNLVIACGGGVVLNRINIDRLRLESVIVLLTASPSAILKRVSRDISERPLLKTPDPDRRIRELMAFRKPFYERSADITVNTSRLDVDGVVEQITERLKELNR